MIVFNMIDILFLVFDRFLLKGSNPRASVSEHFEKSKKHGPMRPKFPYRLAYK